MNARQKKKQLKRQISKLKRDNELMRGIIADSPKMQELYDLYNKPVNVQQTTMEFQGYKSKRFLPPDRPYDGGIIVLLKRELEKELFNGIKENITYEIDADWPSPTITASIYIGRK